MEYDEIICRFYVKGSRDELDRHRAEKIGMKAYRLCNKWVINPIYTRLFNAIWKLRYPNYTKDEYLDENGAYTIRYYAGCNRIAKIFVLLCGGYDFKERRKVCLNYEYYIKPLETYDPVATHYVDDMISIKEFGAVE